VFADKHYHSAIIDQVKNRKAAKRFLLWGKDSMEKLLTVREVTDLLRISYSTLYRWLSAGTFPAPVNGRGKKLLWHLSQIEDWANYRQSQSAISATATSPTQRKQREKDYRERLAAADRALQRHRTSTK
jgi:excisionase family DNA binding protein